MSRSVVFSRLFSSPPKQIDLSAVGDIENAIQSLKGLDLNDAVNILEKTSNELRVQLNEVKQAADQLIRDYEAIDDLIAEHNDLSNDLENALQSFDDLANELGVDPESNNTFKEGNELMQEAESDNNALVNLTNELSDLYDMANQLNRL